MKPFWKSKTVWIAVLQGVAGVAIAVATNYDAMGVVMVLKTLVDISLRCVTSEAIQ